MNICAQGASRIATRPFAEYASNDAGLICDHGGVFDLRWIYVQRFWRRVGINVFGSWYVPGPIALGQPMKWGQLTWGTQEEIRHLRMKIVRFALAIFSFRFCAGK